MRVTIRDRAALAAIRPINVLAYLRAAGWENQTELGDRAVLMTKANSGGEEEVLVPIRREVADFALRMSEVLVTLERVENRSQEEILSDIVTTSFDLIRVRSTATSAADGSVPIALGVSLFEQARDMVLAAACAAVSPKAYWARRRPPKAVQYLESVRLGQTERGSYVLTVQSPVPPPLRNELSDDVPFERKVSETLVDALAQIKIAAQQSLLTQDFEPFRRAIEQGVSANLCDAIVSLANATSESGLEVSVTYSRTRAPRNGDVHVIATFPPDMIPVIESASRIFKQIDPEEDFSLLGYVERLNRAIGTLSGRVVISSVVDGQPKRITVDLPDRWYEEAILAHKENRAVFCEGELVKEGRSYRLLSPRSFMTLPEIETEGSQNNPLDEEQS